MCVYFVVLLADGVLNLLPEMQGTGEGEGNGIYLSHITYYGVMADIANTVASRDKSQDSW